MSILDKFRLDGKVAVLTGASKGIGEAMAIGFAEAGAKVVVSSRKQEAVDAVAQKIKDMGYEAAAIQAHNGQMEDLKNLVEKTVETFGRLDIVVNNAGTNPAFGPMVNTEISAFDKIMDVNLKGMFELSKLAFPELKKNNGNVINITSIAGLVPDPRTGIYSVSKAAGNMLTRALARDWGGVVRVNAIAPGLVKTKISEALWKNDQVYDQIRKQIPMNRMAEPEEMVGLALFLASDASSYCTGGVFVADGGMVS